MNSNPKNPIRIGLCEMTGCGVIVEAESNCVYFNETAGDAFDLQELSGHFLPVNIDHEVDDYTAALEYKLSELFGETKTVDFKLATAINELLLNSMSTQGIGVDFEKLNHSAEAWVYVTVKQTTFGAVECNDVLKGVLTWRNQIR